MSSREAASARPKAIGAIAPNGYELSLLENKIQHFTDSFSMAWADYYQITPNTKATMVSHAPTQEQLRTLLPNVGPLTTMAIMMTIT